LLLIVAMPAKAQRAETMTWDSSKRDRDARSVCDFKRTSQLVIRNVIETPDVSRRAVSRGKAEPLLAKSARWVDERTLEISAARRCEVSRWTGVRNADERDVTASTTDQRGTPPVSFAERTMALSIMPRRSTHHVRLVRPRDALALDRMTQTLFILTEGRLRQTWS